MITTVRLQKFIAIHNPRLAKLHYLVTASTLVGLLWYKFFLGHEQYTQIPMSVRVALRWNEPATIQGMEAYYAHNPIVEQVCHQAPYTNYTPTERWGFLWNKRVTCTNMCTLDSVLNHSTWESLWNKGSQPTVDEMLDGKCWGDFQSFGMGQRYTALQFLQNHGDQDAILTTSKNDWIVDHTQRSKYEHVEMVPQGTAGVLHIDYRYTFASEPPFFPFAQQNKLQNLQGSNEHAKTVILDVGKNPVRLIEAGEPIEFTVAEAMQWSFDDNIPGAHMQSQLISGGQYNVEINCFGDDIDVASHFGRDKLPRYGPTLLEPVCFIEPSRISSYYQVAVQYEIPDNVQQYSIEVMSETKGLYFKCINGIGSASVYDGNALLMSVTSMLVILALPKRFTSIVAARFLGPLSEMYRRSIVEPYDIERATAAAATVIATNMTTFQAHSSLDSKGKQHLHATDVLKILVEATEYRAADLDEVEVASLARFVFEGIRAKGEKESISLLSEFFGCDCNHHEAHEVAMSKSDYTRGISLDEWNEARMEGEKVTFDAVVQLFDRDRRRLFLEDFFTPHKIKTALVRAGRHSGNSNLNLSQLLHRADSGLSQLMHRADSRRSIHDDPPSLSIPSSEDQTHLPDDQTHRLDRIAPDSSADHGPHGELSEVEVSPQDEVLRELERITARLQAAEQRLVPMEETLNKGIFSEGTEKSAVESRGGGESAPTVAADPFVKRLEHLESRVSRNRDKKIWATAILKSLGPLSTAEEEQDSSAPRPQTRRRRSSPEGGAGHPPSGPSRLRHRARGSPARIAEDAAPGGNDPAPAGDSAGRRV